MQRLLLLFIFILASHPAFSQIIFEKGYLIDNSGQETSCLIRNLQWLKNPTEIDYKIDENSDVQIATISSIREFGFDNGSKYVRETVEIDRSSRDYNPGPEFKEETLFLKVLIKGSANLYAYADSNLERFFYSVQGSPIKQLVYKVYKAYHAEGKNTQYKQQLLNDLNCETFNISTFEKLDYNRKELTKFFVRYHECKGDAFVVYQDPKVKRKAFNFGIHAGMQTTNMNFINSKFKNRTADFDNKIGFSAGLSVELVLPFNRNKWAVFVEPTFQSYDDTKAMRHGDAAVSYKSIQTPIGLRHYMFLNNNSALFLEGFFLLDSPFQSSLKMSNVIEVVDFKTNFSGGVGVGFKYQKFNVTARYFAPQDLASNYHFYKVTKNTATVSVGYQFL